MINILGFSWTTHILITVIIGLCVLSQTLALGSTFYSRMLNIELFFDNLLELSILLEIIIFSLMHGQIVNGFKNGFVIPSGYENARILFFLIIIILALIVSIIKRKISPTIILIPSLISLPIIEKFLGSVYIYFFISSLLFFFQRSINICIFKIKEIKTNISALSVKNAIDTLHTGVLFSEQDGNILLINYQMQNLMYALTGNIFRNSIQFYELLIKNKNESNYKIVELDGQNVYILSDETAWMYTKTDIKLKSKSYVNISFADVSELWMLTCKLQIQNQKLNNISDELKKTISNLHILCKEREIKNAKIRAHDILGQRLSILLGNIQNKKNIDSDFLKSLSINLLEELKEERQEIDAYDELKSIVKVFDAIGVVINYEGKLPNDQNQACLIIDIIREGSTNAVRHGFATQIDIKMEKTKHYYKMIITNNGHTTLTPFIYGSGIKEMKNIVRTQGGILDILQYPVFTLSVLLNGGAKYD